MIVVTSFALISLMFLLMVRVTDPLMPRAMFGVLNTLLYFPSGAVYPQQGFPGWMQVIAVVDPFTYAVHAFKSLLLKNTGFDAIGCDLLYLIVFSIVAMTRRRCCSSGRCDDDATRSRDARAAARPRGAAVRRARLQEGHRARDLPRGRAPTSRRSTITSATRSGCTARCSAKAIETHAGDDRGGAPGRTGGASEQKLRAYIRVFLQRVVGHGHDSWIHQLMAHEIADPTPALDLVIDQVIRPRMAYLSELVADILRLPADDERVLRCVLSIQSQCLLVLRNAAADRLYPKLKLTPPTIHELADHIADFSIAGILSLRRPARRRPERRRRHAVR